ncbi:hypothetical protein GCM10009623_15740 [Nocardioides aestuarii]|uniref:DUF4386 family protein n=1 Tax=Nocardioides aestuarii TaxID=252231 RepID=A0ABW4TJ88_9ACTN
MTQELDTRTTAAAATSRPRDVVVGAALVAGALLFLPSGLLHPEPGPGTGLEQVHDMVTDPLWIPSAALMVGAFALFAVAFVRLRNGAERLRRVLGWGALTSAAVALGAFVYLFGQVGAEPLARDEATWFSWVMFATHLVVNPAWGLAVAAIAVAGASTQRRHGPSWLLSLVAGVVGGLAWAVSMVTAPYLDLDDVLFPIAGTLLTLWFLGHGIAFLRGGR